MAYVKCSECGKNALGEEGEKAICSKCACKIAYRQIKVRRSGRERWSNWTGPIPMNKSLQELIELCEAFASGTAGQKYDFCIVEKKKSREKIIKTFRRKRRCPAS